MKGIVVDNSLEVTGAFKAAFNILQQTGRAAEWAYFIPQKSKNKAFLESYGVKVFTFQSYELSRHPKNILLYLPFLFWNGYQLSRIVQKHQITLIYQNEIFILSGLVAKVFCKVKVLTHIRVLPTIFPKKLYRLWLQLHDRFADKIACVSFICAKEARIVYPVRKHIDVLYDFIVPEEKQPPIVIRNCADSARILFLGNYTQGKGQDLALQTLLKFKELHPGWKVEIHFYGSDFDYAPNVAYRQQLANLIKEYRLETVAFLHDFTSDIEAVMKENDLLLNLSVAESFSFVVGEAMSFGIPVIATNSGGPGELIEDGKTGVLVAADAEVIAAAIQELLMAVEWRKSISDAGKQRIRSLVENNSSKEIFNIF